MQRFEKLLNFKFSIDTRTVQKGEVFVALSGENFDGNDFIEEALKKGASYVVYDREKISDAILGTYADKLIYVDNSREFLKNFAKFKREKSKAKFIGITGSTGKTTTKELISFLLREHGYKVSITKGNFNNEIGMPVSVLNSELEDDFVIIEIGMNQKGEISELSTILRPDYGIITNIETSHVGNFASLLEIASEKFSMFNNMRDRGVGYYFGDLGLDSFAVTRISNLNLEYLECKSELRLEEDGFLVRVGLGVANEFSFKMRDADISIVKNAMLALLFIKDAIMLGEEADSIRDLAQKLENFIPVRGRGDVVRLNVSGKQIQVMDHSYNASISSLRNGIKTLSVLGKLRKGRTIALIGDILELGTEQVQEYCKILPMVDKYEVDQVFMCGGEEMEDIYQNIDDSKRGGYAKDSLQLLELLKDKLEDNDTIFVKGSHAMHMEYIIDGLKKIGEKC